MHFNEKGLLQASGLEEAAINAIKLAKEESNVDNIGLRCRWSTINRAVLKNWRFNNIYLLAGASGSAKSYILNMLRTDFTDTEAIHLPAKGVSTRLIDQLTSFGEFCLKNDQLVREPLNGDYKKKILWLNFGFDMGPEVEMLRTAAIMAGSNYAYLLSSEAKEHNGKYEYNTLSKEELYIITQILKEYVKSRTNIIMIRQPGTIQDILILIDKYANKYKDHKIIVSIDHLLLIDKGNLKGDLESQNESIKKLKDIRDIYQAMIIPLAQMNSDIEDDRRRMNPKLHYPMKSDIYMGGQVFQSSDFVFTIFMPESIGMETYGKNLYPTKNLIHFSMIKSRHGRTGQAWLINGLAHGQLYETKPPKNSIGEKFQWTPIKTLIKSC